VNCHCRAPESSLGNADHQVNAGNDRRTGLEFGVGAASGDILSAGLSACSLFAGVASGRTITLGSDGDTSDFSEFVRVCEWRTA